MRLPERFSWLIPAALVVGVGVALIAVRRSAVTVSVLELKTVAGSSYARMELHNGGGKPIMYLLHSMDHEPAYNHFVRWYDGSWRPPLLDGRCGIDLVEAKLGAGQTISFTASVIHEDEPGRLGLSYWQDGVEHTALSDIIDQRKAALK